MSREDKTGLYDFFGLLFAILVVVSVLALFMIGLYGLVRL